MPEYLAPGVFVEEVSFRAKSIEGVSTSTTGFVGMTRYGPVHYPGGPTVTRPRVVGSFTEFERVYGGLEPLQHTAPVIPYTTHAARAFFMNGGQRLYMARAFAPRQTAPNVFDYGIAQAPVISTGPAAKWLARWPGASGNVIIDCSATRTDNLAFLFPNQTDQPVNRFTWGYQVRGAITGALVEVKLQPPSPDPKAAREAPLDINNLFVLLLDPTSGRQTFVAGGTPTVGTKDIATGEYSFAPGTVVEMRVLEMNVLIRSGDRIDPSPKVAAHPAQPRFIGKVLERDYPANEDSVVWLDNDLANQTDADAGKLFMALVVDPANPGLRRMFRLTGGHDGALISADEIAGKQADPDDRFKPATGLEALAEIDDIAIVAAPDAGALDADSRLTATQYLIAHAEREKYRIAVVDGPEHATLTKIREFRGKFDTTYGAIYHPWIEVLDPLSRASAGVPQAKLLLPPSGFVAGIYARNDITRGVHKAPANEIVRGLTRFEVNINRMRNEILNPEGVNCLRFFEWSGSRVWGARTMTSDSEWKYVNVRRLFIYLEHSLDKATQWVVFEPNNDQLWGRIRRMVEDFLFVLWRDGALLGRTPEEAYFVACDRTTMTQNDLDNGRLICLVGVAPVKPAEFVIFRVGQWTGDARN